MKERIIEMLHEINPFEDIDENTQFIKEGIMDSLTLVLFIEQLEEEFDIQVQETFLKPENFETVDKIVELVKKCHDN